MGEILEILKLLVPLILELLKLLKGQPSEVKAAAIDDAINAVEERCEFGQTGCAPKVKK